MALVVVAVFVVVGMRCVSDEVLGCVVLVDEVVFIGLPVLVCTWPETTTIIKGARMHTGDTHALAHALTRTQTHTRTR